MGAPAIDPNNLRAEAARLAATLLRFQEPAAHLSRASTPLGALRVGTEAYIFIPSWKTVPRVEVESFLVSLPSPALLAPTTMRGSIALLLLHELSGDRRRWAEKTFSNFAAVMGEMAGQLGLAPESRVLVEFDDESHVFSYAAVLECTQQFAVQVGLCLTPLAGAAEADAVLGMVRGDGHWYRGRSCFLPARQPEKG
jgi:hypothetical protein